MSVTSNWVCESVDRNIDLGTSGGITLRRNAWTLTRSRISDASYSSELLSTATSLSCYNGGVTETISAPSRTSITFGTSTNWIETTDTFIEAGYTVNQRPVYVMSYGKFSKYNNSQSIAIVAIPLTEGATTLHWHAIQLSPFDIADKNLPTWGGSNAGQPLYSKPFCRTNTSFQAGAGTYVTPNGISFNYLVGGWSTESTPTVSTAQGSFLCTSDKQSYQTSGVDWYTQTQTWNYRDEWVVV
jgi:hypothetical protein